MNAENTKLVEQIVADGNGYLSFVELPNGNLAAMMQLMFTVAIVSGVSPTGYNNRWCYHNRFDAQDALEEWAENPDQIEPTGWHRHPPSGRRIREDGSLYVEL